MNKVINEYIANTNCLDPVYTEPAMKFAYQKGIEQEQEYPSAKTCINVANILFKEDFKSIYEVNEFLIKHLV